MSLVLGVDLGKKADHTAAVLLERMSWQPQGVGSAVPDPEYHNVLRYVGKLPTGISYVDDAVPWIVGIVEATEQMRGVAPTVVLDCSGVGEGVFEVVAKEMKRLGQRRPKGVQIVGGDIVVKVTPHYHRVGQRKLVETLAGQLTARTLHAGSEHRLLADLVSELENFGYKLSAKGMKFSARKGHDDLVNAALLGVYWANEVSNSFDTMMSLYRTGRGGLLSM